MTGNLKTQVHDDDDDVDDKTYDKKHKTENLMTVNLMTQVYDDYDGDRKYDDRKSDDLGSR